MQLIFGLGSGAQDDLIKTKDLISRHATLKKLRATTKEKMNSLPQLWHTVFALVSLMLSSSTTFASSSHSLLLRLDPTTGNLLTPPTKKVQRAHMKRNKSISVEIEYNEPDFDDDEGQWAELREPWSGRSVQKYLWSEKVATP